MKYAWIRVAFSGVKFFYSRTYKRNWQTLATMKLQRDKTTPEVLTIEQLHCIIDACRIERIAAFFRTTYAMGLRLEEARNLKVGDIAPKTCSVPDGCPFSLRTLTLSVQKVAACYHVVCLGYTLFLMRTPQIPVLGSHGGCVIA
ncbi:hypothetical protein [Novipirellula rosea]|uniref:Tyr recombinase domain-containing protein n=1 Tax=Novipirellula rosea TaxID=1031540 RepID=A0ABP8M6G9_9BACT